MIRLEASTVSELLGRLRCLGRDGGGRCRRPVVVGMAGGPGACHYHRRLLEERLREVFIDAEVSGHVSRCGSTDRERTP